MSGCWQLQSPPTSSGSALNASTVFSLVALGENGPPWTRKAREAAWACSEHHPLTIKGRLPNIAICDWGTPMS